MKLSNNDYRVLIGFLNKAKTAKEAKAYLQMWFDEKSEEVYKEAWLQFCDEYEIEDDHWYEEENGLDDEGY